MNRTYTPQNPLKGPIPISGIYIHRIAGSGLSYQLHIVSGDFEFKGNFDKNFANFTEVVAAAMKFFGAKYGLVTLHSEGIVRVGEGRKDRSDA